MSMNYKVVILSEAEKDILDIYKYILLEDSPNNTNNILEKIEETCLAFQNLPERGHVPPELDRIGMTVYREIHCKPYRVIYEIDRKQVFVHCILDGRRSIQQLLERRLLR